MPRDRAQLQEWYRNAMRGRVGELRELLPGLRAGDVSACNEARAIGQALRGSGATFGFPRLSEVATLVETTSDTDALRRVEGLIAELVGLIRGDDHVGSPVAWLSAAAELPDDPVQAVPGDEPEPEGGGGRFEDRGPGDISSAWAEVGRRSTMDGRALAARVAGYFGLKIADLGTRSRAALRLVPEAVATGSMIVPLREDSLTITVATADPTSLATELRLARLTGRSPVFEVAPPDALDIVLSEIYDRSERRPGRTESAPAAEPESDEDPREPEGGAIEASSDVAMVQPAGARGPDMPRAPSPRVVPLSTRSQGAGVLVVDDEEGERLVLRSILERRGYAVIEAGDGIEAMEQVRQREEIGLVVADLNMPQMDGLELIWELRDAHGPSHLPVIVVTGEVDEILETQLIEEGADDYIRKPVDPRLFLARVEATLRRAEN